MKNKDAKHSLNQGSQDRIVGSRRRFVKGGVVWVPPVVTGLMLPTHAQASEAVAATTVAPPPPPPGTTVAPPPPPPGTTVAPPPPTTTTCDPSQIVALSIAPTGSATADTAPCVRVNTQFRISAVNACGDNVPVSVCTWSALGSPSNEQCNFSGGSDPFVPAPGNGVHALDVSAGGLSVTYYYDFQPTC